MRESENEEEVENTDEVVEYEEIVERIASEKPQQRRLGGGRELGAEYRPHWSGKDRYIEQKRRYACGNEPIEKFVVRAVKPLLLVVHGRIVMLIKHVVEIFLSPPKHRLFLETLVGKISNNET